MSTSPSNGSGAARGATAWERGLDDARRVLIRAAMRESKGSIARAARALGMHPNSLYRYLHVLGIRGEFTIKRGGPRPGCNRRVVMA